MEDLSFPHRCQVPGLSALHLLLGKAIHSSLQGLQDIILPFQIPADHSQRLLMRRKEEEGHLDVDFRIHCRTPDRDPSPNSFLCSRTGSFSCSSVFPPFVEPPRRPWIESDLPSADDVSCPGYSKRRAGGSGTDNLPALFSLFFPLSSFPSLFCDLIIHQGMSCLCGTDIVFQ